MMGLRYTYICSIHTILTLPALTNICSLVMVRYFSIGVSRVADPHYSYAVPDPGFHFSADPDPVLHFNADSDPFCHSSANPDPSFHSNTDLDPASNSNADPQPSFINFYLHLYFIAERQMFVTEKEEIGS